MGGEEKMNEKDSVPWKSIWELFKQTYSVMNEYGRPEDIRAMLAVWEWMKVHNQLPSPLPQWISEERLYADAEEVLADWYAAYPNWRDGYDTD
jgi:hypothetical protein